jgi:DNA polymerase-3 subunit epsilon
MKMGLIFGNSASPMREHKGKSLLATVSDYSVIDIETTGLDAKFDSLLEIAAIKYRNDTPVDEFKSLVNYPYGVDAFISSLTGLTDDVLRDAPSTNDVLPQFKNFIGDDILIAHNANFDINFLYDKFFDLSEQYLSNDFIDTLRLARRLYKDIDNHRLDTLIDHLDLPPRTLHRALRDVEITAELYQCIKRDIANRGIDINNWSKRHGPSVKARDVISSNTEFDEDHPLFGKVCVFTGSLDGNITRKEAMQFVVDVGGIVGDGVTVKTNYLILGNGGYNASVKNGKSAKHRKADATKLKGFDIEVISENTFFDLLRGDE